MKRLIIVVVGVMFMAQSVYADNWFERDMKHADRDVKAEVLKVYNEFHQSAAKTKADIVRTTDKLAQAIEDKATEVEKNKLIKKITDEVVKLGDETRMTYNHITDKMGMMSKGFTKEFYDDNDEEEFYTIIFTPDGVEEVYELIDEAELNTPSKKEIEAKYGAKIKEVNQALAKAYNKYRGFWLIGITSGSEFEAAKKAYTTAIMNAINLAVTVYSAEVGKLDGKQMDSLANQRRKEVKKELNKINEKAMHVNVKTQSQKNTLSK